MRPVAASLAVVVQDGAALLIRRANPPDQGLWSFPGGRIEPGETLFAAAERELVEETGLSARATALLDCLDIIGHAPDGTLSHHFLLLAVRCVDAIGTLSPASDALDARWFAVDALTDGDPRFSAGAARLARLACA